MCRCNLLLVSICVSSGGTVKRDDSFPAMLLFSTAVSCDHHIPDCVSFRWPPVQLSLLHEHVCLCPPPSHPPRKTNQTSAPPGCIQGPVHVGTLTPSHRSVHKAAGARSAGYQDNNKLVTAPNSQQPIYVVDVIDYTNKSLQN